MSFEDQQLKEQNILPEKEHVFISPNTDKETFEKGFNPREYLKTYYPIPPDLEKILWASEIVKNQYSRNTKIDIKDMVERLRVSSELAENLAIFDFQRVVAKKLLQAYPQDNIEVLDVGGGPTIYQHIAMSLQAGSITHSEFLEQNRTEVNKWVNNEEGSYNWDSYFDFIVIMLNKDEDYKRVLYEQLQGGDRETKAHAGLVKSLLEGDTENFKVYLREKLNQRVIQGDVFSSDLGLGVSKKYDVASSGREGSVEMLTSNFTVESATGDRKKWEQGMKNITSKIKNRGFLALTALRNAEWYSVGEEKMPAVKINENDLIAILKNEGFDIIELRTLEGSDKETVGYEGMVFVFAQKS